MHYIDEGEGDPILFLHGHPTSSYLWRNVLPYMTGLGRCIALDFIGMGKSDKPDIDYTWFDQSKYLEGFIEEMGLENFTLVVHDWGTALGFYYAMRNESNVKSIAFMEAVMKPWESWNDFHPLLRETYQGFRTPEVGWDMLVNKNTLIEWALPNGIIRTLTDEEMNTYRRPFLDPVDRKVVWAWPQQLPIEGAPPKVVAAHNAFMNWLPTSKLPMLLIYATPGGVIMEEEIKWCEESLQNIKTVEAGSGRHFIQEDCPHGIGEELAKWYKDLS